MELRGRRRRQRTGHGPSRAPGTVLCGTQGKSSRVGGPRIGRGRFPGVPTVLSVCMCRRLESREAQQSQVVQKPRSRRWPVQAEGVTSDSSQPAKEGWEGSLDAREMPTAPLPVIWLCCLPSLGLLRRGLDDLPSNVGHPRGFTTAVRGFGSAPGILPNIWAEIAKGIIKYTFIF